LFNAILCCEGPGESGKGGLGRHDLHYANRATSQASVIVGTQG
jgi:hypothetical protein